MAAEREPARFGGQTTLVHADAADVKDDEIRALAKVCLAIGGSAFQMSNGRGLAGTSAGQLRAWTLLSGGNLAPIAEDTLGGGVGYHID